MAGSELAIRFTEEKYATRAEVIKELKMSLIDNIWSNILSYRSDFNKYLALRNVERNQYSFCRCYNVSNLIDTVIRKEDQFLKEYKPTINDNDSVSFKINNLNKILSAVANYESLDIPQSMINAMVRGQNIQLSSNSKLASNYLKALRHCSNYDGPIDNSFIMDLYRKLSEEFVSSFRQTEDNKPANIYLFDRIYSSAPVKLIEPMMGYLFSFIDNSTEDRFVIASACLYYINYVKPFVKYNEEIAFLLFKTILARELGEVAFYLPVEEMLLNKNSFDKVMLDSQKSNDITYVVIHVLNYLTYVYESNIDNIIAIKSNALKTDFYRLDEDEHKAQEVIVTPVKEETEEQTSLKLDKVETKVDKPIIEAKPQAKKEKEKNNLNLNQRAFEYKEERIDEKELKKMVNHLLELDPLLSKKEAKFYAGHCTLGKMYSIAQFKKEIGCVYETARTSMEHLATLGYYKKEQVKNKFFYTPISRK